jgi:hypothetical protein
MAGASGSNQDMVVGRTNESEERTRLVAINGDNAPGGYSDDFVLDVGVANGHVLTDGAHGVDGIHTTGSTPLPTGGVIGTLPPGNGLVARGLNGIVGYVHAALRDKTEESNAQAGVLGEGGTNSAGVFGRGQNGVVGYEQNTSRDTPFESAEKAGVLGCGETGVSGKGTNGAGVHGRGLPGVHGQCDTNGPGVLAQGETGVFAEGTDGAGVQGSSASGNGGIFESNKRKAQIWIVPLDPSIDTPAKLLGKAEPGELCVTLSDDGNRRTVANLWFCILGGPASAAVWTKIA